MKRIIIDQSEAITKWVAVKIGEDSIPMAYGVGLEHGAKLVAGVVYAQKTASNVHTHIASDGSRHWLTPEYLGFIFAYPFNHLKCERITGFVRDDNIDSRRFVENLGFIREGRLRRACADGTDLIVYGMLREECRFLTGKYHAAFLDYFGLSRPPASSVS
jgi:hypothetical protein